jgi:L-2-hydroxyglutarate oxidase LhgO
MSVIGKVLLGDNATDSKEDNLMQSSDFNHVSSTTKKRVKLWDIT